MDKDDLEILSARITNTLRALGVIGNWLMILVGWILIMMGFSNGMMLVGLLGVFMAVAGLMEIYRK